MLLYKKNVPGGHSSCVLSQKQDCRGDNPGRNAYIRMEKRMLRKRSLFLYIVIMCFCVPVLFGCTRQGGKDETVIPGVNSPEQNREEIDAGTSEAIPTVPTPAAPTEMIFPTPSAIPTPTAAPTPTATPTPVVTDPYDGRFWLGRYAEDTQVLMTATEIAAHNEANYRIAGTKMVNLTETDNYTEHAVRAMIESYSLPSRKVFDNHQITASDKESLMRERNLDVLRGQSSQTVELQYGVLVANTDLRSFPTAKRLTSEVQGRFDYLQETKLLVNEPVIILHKSLDGTWCFVQAENYYGWIRESAIAYCTKAELIAVADAIADTQGKQIAVITKNGDYGMGDKSIYLRMGTRLLCNGAIGDMVELKIPERGAEGMLVWKYASVSATDATGETCFVYGYLPYTRANVMRLAIRLLGAPYAWGDALSFGADPNEAGDNGMDCSSTVSAVLRCFGFAMPRNTGTQRNMDCRQIDMSGFEIRQREALLDGLQGGELLYTSGHVMLYLGSENGAYYILHNTSTESRDDGGKDEFYCCVITTTGLGKSGQTILERLIQMNALFSID